MHHTLKCRLSVATKLGINGVDMEHHCRDCSYRGKRLSQGSCPACGSANIGRSKGQTSEDKPSSKVSTIVMIILWALFAYLLLDKFL